MKLNLKYILALLIIVSIPQLVNAESSTGCGLGWQVTKSMTTSAAGTRATTNASSSNTFGMTSGTSGCEKHALVLNDSLDKHFTEANFEFIAADAAIGSGEYLNGWARSLGCSDFEQKEFNKAVQKNYINLFGNGQTFLHSLKNVKEMIKSSPALSNSCNTRS